MNFHLQPYRGAASRFRCPACNHRTKTFTCYVDIETNEPIAPHVGRCDRQDNCGYHLSPSQHFREEGLINHAGGRTKHYRRKATKNNGQLPANGKAAEAVCYISPDYVNDSFRDYDKNNFVAYLITRFGFDVADNLVGKYRIGTSSYWHGATIFWQLDSYGYIRTGKIMLYNRQSGKRVKAPFNHINWVHAVLLKGSTGVEHSIGSPALTLQPAAPATAITFHLRQCLFGEHLLATTPYKPVAIVESEKTAIIASVLMPAFTWLASGSLEGLNVEKCKVLQNRQVVLFPDANAYGKWKIKALELCRAMPGTNIVVSDELERLATTSDRKKGVDLGDVLQ